MPPALAAEITGIMGIEDLDRANRRYGPGEVGSLNDCAALVPFIVPKRRYATDAPDLLLVTR